MIRRLASVTAASLLAVTALAGCGSADDSNDSSDGGGESGSGGDYCGLIEDVRGDFGEISGEDVTLGDMSDMSDRMSEIADAAPDEVKSDWSSLESAISDYVTALQDAGVAEDKPLGEAVTATLKEDKSKQQDLMEAASGMQAFEKDSEKIQKQVKDECGIDMGSGSSGSSSSQ